jgi:hypothetical protein
MPVVPKHKRLAALRRLGLSEPVVRLAAGEVSHPAFRFACGEPHGVYVPGAAPDRGAPVIPLWESCGGVSAARRTRRGVEFVGFSIEDPDEVWPVARTEQGLLAELFLDLLEYEGNSQADDDLPRAAAAVGFRFLPELRAAIESGDWSDDRERELIERIDTRSASEAGAEPRVAPDPRR